MNQLPKDVIINKIIPYIESDKNREIAQLKEIIEGLRNGSIFLNNCSLCPRKIIIDNYDSDPVKYDPNVKYAVVVCRCCKQTCIYCAVNKNLHLLDTCPDCKQHISIYSVKNIILFFVFFLKIEKEKIKMNQLPKDVIVNVIIPKIVEDKNREIEEVKKQNVIFKKIIYDAAMQDAITDIPCQTCDKHFVLIGMNFKFYDSPINILDESTELVFLDCDKCANYYCMDCVFKIPIETRRTHLYCPVCKNGNNCTTYLSQYTY